MYRMHILIILRRNTKLAVAHCETCTNQGGTQASRFQQKFKTKHRREVSNGGTLLYKGYYRVYIEAYGGVTYWVYQSYVRSLHGNSAPVIALDKYEAPLYNPY